MTARLERLAEAVLERRALDARSLVQEMVRAGLVGELTRPHGGNASMLSVAAALAELLAERHHVEVPAWCAAEGPLAAPFFVVERALRWPGLREQCEREAPEPLRSRQIYSPASFLTYA